MSSKLFMAAGLAVALFISGCGNDEEFNSGDRNNYPTNNGSGIVQPPINPLAPVVTLDAGVFTSTRGAAGTAFAPGATVTDADTANFQNGVLTISAGNGLTLIAPNTTLGTVTGGGTGNVSIVLNGTATPALVQQYLRTVTLASTGAAALGANTVTVTLSDGTGQTSQAVTRNVNVI